MRLPIALGTIKPNGGVSATLPHFLQRLKKFFEHYSSHISPVFFSLHVHFESLWHPTDRRECKFAFERRIGKFFDSSGKRMDGIGIGIRMLIGRAVKVYYYFPNELPLLASRDG